MLPENIYSLKILKKNGFSEEGLLRKYDHGRIFADTLMLSVLREDYESIKTKNPSLDSGRAAGRTNNVV